MIPQVLAIVGMSGCGKDTVAAWLSQNRGYERIVSYTTRAMRPGETDGVEHHFVKRRPYNIMMRTDIMAWYHDTVADKWYWTLESQFLPDHRYVYIVDEGGLRYLIKAAERGAISLIKVLVQRDLHTREQTIDPLRLARDTARTALPPSEFDIVIQNHGSLDMLHRNLQRLFPQS